MAIPVPQDLIVEIFSKLPVESLCRFKALSKHFLALISHPKFVRLHLSQSKTQKFLNYHSLTRSLYSVDYETSYHHDEVVALKLNFPKKNKRRSRWVSIYGSCNGLVLLRSRPEPYAIYVYNPSTREYRQIPETNDDQLDIQHTCTCYCRLYGFGYAQPVDDYKVVTFCKCEENIVHVFSLRNHSWETVNVGQSISYNYVDNEGGICLDGAIHWMLHGDHGEYKIVAFDLMEEKFKTLPLPREIPENSRCSIGVLGGCLLFIEKTPASQNENSFWIMKKYNVIESWTAISMDEDDDFSQLRALSYLNINSEILVALHEERLVFYNRRDETCKVLPSRKIVYAYPYCPDVYLESLVSPNYNYNFTCQGLHGFW